MSKSSSSSSAGRFPVFPSLLAESTPPDTPCHPARCEGAKKRQFDEDYATLHRQRKAAKTPAEHGQAEGEFRQRRFVDPGLEGPLETDNTYHLTTDVTAALRVALETARGLDADPFMQKTRRGFYALVTLSQAHKGRYRQGVRWLRVALERNGIAADDLHTFDQERERFAERFDPLMDTGPRPPVEDAERAIREMYAELVLLQNWLVIAGQQYRADEMRKALAEIRDLWETRR